MQVIKRSGIREEVCFDKVSKRIKDASKNLNLDPLIISQQVVSRIYNGVKTSELDELTARICASLVTDNQDYGILASRIIISNNHKITSPSFSETIYHLYNLNIDKEGNKKPLISDELYNIVMENKDKINSSINYNKDYDFDYFAFKTLEKSYLYKIKGKVIERIQHLFMRVSLGLHGEDIKSAIESYNFMSGKYFIHGSPTLFNSGTSNPQLLSCFLLGTDDSINNIFKTISDAAKISKWAGGIGIHISNIRSNNTPIHGTNGVSRGIIPMLKVYNETFKYVNQGGKRKGSAAIYLEPHHPDSLEFLDIRKNHGNEDDRARDLFTAMYISDLFMKCVKEDKDWYLLDPSLCPNLTDCYGEEYNKLYQKYCDLGYFSKKIKARELWTSIINSQIETGTPYILFKDHINKKSNQKNLGTIKSSNLCAEITEYSDSQEYACCTLASLGLPRYIEDNQFNFSKLEEVVLVVVKNLNKIIDRNYYPVPETKKSNLRHRPIGIGIQGLADVFAMLSFPFDSQEAKDLNVKIAETIYYASIKASCQLAKEYADSKKEFILSVNEIKKLIYPLDNNARNDIECYIKYLKTKEINDSEMRRKISEIIHFWDSNPSLRYESFNSKYLGSYSTFEGSPISEGKFQFDLCNYQPSDRYEWDKLREEIKTYGIRNSLLVALMPTATTSQILGNNECFEPYTSNIYTRRTLAGDFIIVNKYLMKDLNKLGIWSKSLKEKIISNNGSIQDISDIPDDIKKRYKIVWEIKQRDIIDMAVGRSPFICQTQSMNLFFRNPDMTNLSSALFYAWQNGLKTGCYYIRSQPPIQAQQFTVKIKKQQSHKSCPLDPKERANCDACGA